jgi:catechol 2,3-dioxygenase-like lactoylglutathione lyase family enzyme
MTDEFRRFRASKPATTRARRKDVASKTHITEVGTVLVAVNDQDDALDFYVGKLGFEKRADSPFGEGDRWVEVAPKGAATRIALMPPREGQTVGVPTGIGLVSDDIDALHSELKERGVDVDQEVSRLGDPVPPIFFFRDHDGNTLFVAG